MSDRESVISILRATLLSCKGSVSLRECNRDFKELQGEWVPYGKLGYKSLVDLFQDIPGFRVYKGSSGEFLVDAIASQETQHIAEMVARQKNSNSKKTLKKNFQPRQVHQNHSWRPGTYPNMWRYKSPAKVPASYDKPQSTTINSNNFRQPFKKNTNSPPKPERTVSIKEEKKPIAKSIQKQQIINTNKSILIKKPTSSLSGFRPGDILAKATPAMNNYSTKLSAADRMSALQFHLQTSEPPARHSVLPPVTPSNQLQELDLTITKDIKCQLDMCCLNMGLPVPVFKSHENRPKRGPSTYDCTVKIGNEYSFTTYPESLSSKELALETAAGRALTQLLQIKEKNKSDQFTAPGLALQRIIKIVQAHVTGLWANTLPTLYREEYKESLPHEWLGLVEKSPFISIEQGATGLAILLPEGDPERLHSSSPTSSVSSTSVDEYWGLPPLQYPEDHMWNVYVMSAYSTVEVWLRIIGESYSENFESLTTDMELHFLGNCKPCSTVTEGVVYAVNLEDGWVRARVLEQNLENGTALCFLIDTGDEETHSLSKLFDLPPQFLHLPPQAILCRLAGLEEYSMASGDKDQLSEMLVNKVLVAEILETPEDIMNNEDPTITIVLFDTSTDIDVNVNKELLRRMTQKASSPKLTPGITEVYVSEVCASGKVYVQIHNESFRLLQQMLQQVVSGPFPKEALHAVGPLHPAPNVYYLVKSLSGEWMRAVLRGGVMDGPEGGPLILVRFIDCGRTERVPVSEVLLLERVSAALNSFPVQVLELTLHNLAPLGNEMLSRVRALLPLDSPVLCKQMSLGSNVVELFVRSQPQNILFSINNAISLEKEFGNKVSIKSDTIDPMIELTKKKERIFARSSSNPPSNRDLLSPTHCIPTFTIPEKGSYLDIQVVMAANPWNFIVQPMTHEKGLVEMMSKLQVTCEKLPVLSTSPVIGGIYATRHESDHSWYRVSVQGVISKTMASIYFIDFGDLCMVDVSKLKELSQEFKNLPALAIKARLHGVSPTNQDWSVDDCIRFQQLVVDQRFVSIVEKIDKDPINKNEILLTLNLIDTTTQEDLYLNVLLEKEGRAILR